MRVSERERAFAIRQAVVGQCSQKVAVVASIRDTVIADSASLNALLDAFPGCRSGAYGRLDLGGGLRTPQASPAGFGAFKGGLNPTFDHRPFVLGESAGDLEEHPTGRGYRGVSFAR
jgi:hypothetical protein